MFELLAMAYLGICAVDNLCEHHRLMKDIQKEAALNELKMKVWRYAVLNDLSYDYVVKCIEEKRLTFALIDKYLERVSS